MRKKGRPPYQTLIPGDTTWLYVFRCGPFFKVGIGNQPNERLVSLQVGNPFQIKFVSKLEIRHEIAAEVEYFTHQQLSKYHYRGEWFHCHRAAVWRAVKKAAAFAKNRLPIGQLTDDERTQVQRRFEESDAVYRETLRRFGEIKSVQVEHLES